MRTARERRLKRSFPTRRADVGRAQRVARIAVRKPSAATSVGRSAVAYLRNAWRSSSRKRRHDELRVGPRVKNARRGVRREDRVHLSFRKAAAGGAKSSRTRPPSSVPTAQRRLRRAAVPGPAASCARSPTISHHNARRVTSGARTGNRASMRSARDSDPSPAARRRRCMPTNSDSIRSTWLRAVAPSPKGSEDGETSQDRRRTQISFAPDGEPSVSRQSQRRHAIASMKLPEPPSGSTKPTLGARCTCRLQVPADAGEPPPSSAARAPRGGRNCSSSPDARRQQCGRGTGFVGDRGIALQLRTMPRPLPPETRRGEASRWSQCGLLQRIAHGLEGRSRPP